MAEIDKESERSQPSGLSMLPTHALLVPKALAQLEVSHALLICGTRGHGAGVFTRLLAKSLLCERVVAAGHAKHRLSACGECKSCHWFELNHHPDYRRLSLDDAEPMEEGDDSTEVTTETEKKSSKKLTQITLEMLRPIQGFFTVSGHRAGLRVVLIDPIESMNNFASNYLLKTLEEPTEGLKFLLVTESPGSIMPTIRSRCQQFLLPPVSMSEAIPWLVSAGVDQLGKSPQNQAKQLLQWTGGAPLQASNLLDPEQQTIYRLAIETLAAMPETSTLQPAQTLSAIDPRTVFDCLQRWVEDLGRVALGLEPRFFEGQKARLTLLAKQTSVPALGEFLSWIQREKRLVDHPLNWRLFCEQIVSQYCAALRSDRINLT